MWFRNDICDSITFVLNRAPLNEENESRGHRCGFWKPLMSTFLRAYNIWVPSLAFTKWKWSNHGESLWQVTSSACFWKLSHNSKTEVSRSNEVKVHHHIATTNFQGIVIRAHFSFWHCPQISFFWACQNEWPTWPNSFSTNFESRIENKACVIF